MRLAAAAAGPCPGHTSFLYPAGSARNITLGLPDFQLQPGGRGRVASALSSAVAQVMDSSYVK